MRTILFMLAALAASTLFSMFNAAPAHAQNYPFCLVNGPGPGDCKYDTYEQCMATASGTGKYCQPNTWLLPQNNGAMAYGYSRPPRGYTRGYAPQY